MQVAHASTAEFASEGWLSDVGQHPAKTTAEEAIVHRFFTRDR
jgi:hypothetical protein